MNQNLHSLTLGQIVIFLTVVELESLTKAGAKLHMTQSAISKTIAKLERELDLTLFTRHYRELSVTDAAKDLYSQWKPKIEHFIVRNFPAGNVVTSTLLLNRLVSGMV